MGTCVYDGRAVIKSSLTSYIVSGELLPSPLWVSTAWFESRSRIQAISRPDRVYFIHKPDCRSYVRPERLSALERLTFMLQFVRQSSLLTFRTLCFFLTPGTVHSTLFALFNRYCGVGNFRFRINVPAKWIVLGILAIPVIQLWSPVAFYDWDIQFTGISILWGRKLRWETDTIKNLTPELLEWYICIFHRNFIDLRCVCVLLFWRFE